MFTLQNPLPQAVRDEDRLREFYQGLKLVPYVGYKASSSHRFLRVLFDLYELSPSQEACIDDLVHWAFEGEVDVVKRPYNGVRTSNVVVNEDGEEVEEELPPNEAEMFLDLLGSVGLQASDLIEVVQQMYRSFKICGNAYLYYKEKLVLGEKTVLLEVIDPRRVMYIYSDPGTVKSVAISDNFFEGHFEEEPMVARVYPYFVRRRASRETVIHIKHSRDFSRWYGRPDSLASLYAQMTEYKTIVTAAKVSGVETVAKYIMLMKKQRTMARVPVMNGDGDELDFVIEKLRRKVSSQGSIEEVESIGVFTYPEEAPELLKFDVQRDSTYFESVMGRMSDIIFSANRWSKILNGYERAKAGVGGNTMKDEFTARNVGVIQPTQRHWERVVIKKVIGLIGDYLENEEFKKYGLVFEDRIENLIDSLKGSDGGQQFTEQGGSDQEEPGSDPPVE